MGSQALPPPPRPPSVSRYSPGEKFSLTAKARGPRRRSGRSDYPPENTRSRSRTPTSLPIVRPWNWRPGQARQFGINSNKSGSYYDALPPAYSDIRPASAARHRLFFRASQGCRARQALAAQGGTGTFDRDNKLRRRQLQSCGKEPAKRAGLGLNLRQRCRAGA